ncbi:T9SS type A sorting domain-containing protein, partial [Candidatus Poribacteria bacterium]|nr:T9SS type A sorting domain-containing protein [Candidatus Poribacteria bacterium]
LANYPNPFNPETWIPFDLSEAAEVTVSVYDPRGVVVRRLDLGRLAPGAYRRRSAAAYWDGRNDFGERVSSGMYMYELRAGASRQMRRMVVRK